MDNEQGKRRRKLINVPTGITKPSISIQTNTTQLHRSDSDENRRGNGLDYARKPFKNSKVLTILDASNMDFKKNSEPIKLTRTLRERVELSDEVIHSMDVWRKMTRAPVRLEFRSPDWHCGILGSEIVQPILNISCLNQNKYLGFLSELQLHSAIEERWKFPESENWVTFLQLQIADTCGTNNVLWSITRERNLTPNQKELRVTSVPENRFFAVQYYWKVLLLW